MLIYDANQLHLPEDIIHMVILYLDAHELAQLSRTCRRLNKFAESRLWTNLEFHHSSFHEQCDQRQEPLMVSASARLYHWSLSTPGYWKVWKFLEILRNLLSRDTDRFKILCARVRSICTVLEGKPDFWPLLPYFVNLEALELYGCNQEVAEGRHTAFDVRAPPLSKLRFVKLVSYIPACTISWLLASGDTIEQLELELLKEGIPVAQELEEILQDHPEDTHSPLREDRGGTVEGWSSIPRPLSGFLPRRDNREHYLLLPKLRYLHLCQPSDNNLDSELMQNYFWSTHAEACAHEDWKRILRASSQTLETLVVEQKIGIEDTDPEYEREHQFIRSDQDGLRSERLIKMLEGVLSRDTFPVLDSVQLKGIAVVANTPGGKFMELLKGMDIRCEARLGDSCAFDMADGVASLGNWEVSNGVCESPEGEELLASI